MTHDILLKIILTAVGLLTTGALIIITNTHFADNSTLLFSFEYDD